MTDKNRELAITILWRGGELVLQDRSHSGEGGIGFFGGKVKEGEPPERAARRETDEETGIRIRADRLRALGQIEVEGWLVNVFQYALKFGTQLDDEKVEGNPLYMLPADIIKDERLLPGSRAALEEFILKPNGIIDN